MQDHPFGGSADGSAGAMVKRSGRDPATPSSQMTATEKNELIGGLLIILLGISIIGAVNEYHQQVVSPLANHMLKIK